MDKNIKLNDDGTVSPIDPAKPSRYTTEPTIDEQISNIIASDLVLTTDNGQPYIQYDDTAVDKIVALIADQVREARIDAFDVAFDCHDYDKLRAYRAELLKEVK